MTGKGWQLLPMTDNESLYKMGRFTEWRNLVFLGICFTPFTRSIYLWPMFSQRAIYSWAALSLLIYQSAENTKQLLIRTLPFFWQGQQSVSNLIFELPGIFDNMCFSSSSLIHWTCVHVTWYREHCKWFSLAGWFTFTFTALPFQYLFLFWMLMLML